MPTTDPGDASSVGARDELIAAAVGAYGHAYCPYSNYPVGVAMRTVSGAIYAGCNVENSAFPEGTCAEAGAIAAMALAGDRQIAEVVVVTGGPTPGTPCGGCRQRLREFSAPDVLVHCLTIASADPGGSAGADGAATLTISIADLLPHSFGPDFLQR